MSTQYISTNGTDWSTFASAGIIDCILTLRATGADELRFTIDPATWTAAATYATGDTLYFKQDSTPFFVGRIAELPREATGPQHKLSYTVLGPWHRFEKITYGQDWTLRRSSDNAEVTLAKPRVVLGQSSAGASLTTGEQIAAVIDFLIARGVPILKGTIDTGIHMPYDEQKMLNCADAIRTCLRWNPDWVAWFDYTTLSGGIPKPTFNCRARANLSAATLNLTSTTKPEEAALRPRADLVVPGIRIVYEKTHTYDGNNWNSYDLDTAGDDTNAECVDLLFELQGSLVTLNKQTLEVANYPDPDVAAEVKAFFRLHIPWLADIADADLVIEDVTSDGTEGYTAYIVEGAVPDWLLDQIGVEEETITATCSFIRRDNDDNVLEDVESKEISVKLLSTDGETREYQAIGSIDYGETTPSGVAAALYASWSITHYEGQFSLVQSAPDFAYIPGKKLNVSNGLAAWATMAALIQDVTISFADGLTSVRIGPPGRLDADSLVALYRATHARSFSWSRMQRTSSTLAGTETNGPKNLPRERPSDGDPGKKNRLQVRNEDGSSNEHVIDLDPAATAFADAGDKTARTLAVREVLMPELSGSDYVLKRRQIMASESYHDPVDFLVAIPSHPFRFVQASDTGGTVEWGSVAIDGVLKTITDWTNHGSGADLTLSGVTTTTRYYIEIDFLAKTATWKSTAGAFPDGDADTDIWPILTLTCADSVITGIKRHQWCDIHARASGAAGTTHAFKFVQTSTTGGTVAHGQVFLAGVAKTLSGWTDHGTGADLTLSSVTSTTRYYIEIDLATAAASWASTTGAFPSSDADTEIVEVLTLTCAGSVITGIKQHQCSNVRIPSNV
jgi:hypothetical protein